MNIPDIILINETIEKYGYDPTYFKGEKDYKKLVIRTCFICNNIYEQQFINVIRMFKLNKKCKFCANKERAVINSGKMSILMKEKYKSGKVIPPMLGKKHTEDVKNKARERLLGKTFEDLYGKEKSDVIKSKYKKSMLGKNVGRKHTIESRKKMSESQKKIARKGVDSNFYEKNYNSLLTNEDFIRNATKKHGYLYDYSFSEYLGANKPINISCKIHGVFNQIATTHTSGGCGCPKCNCSVGEKKISDFLSKNNIPFKSQFRFKECKNKLPLPFDFYLPNKNLCIEYDGEFHYINFGFNDIVTTKFNDEIKTNYCLNNNIKLIRIPYTEKENIEIVLIKELLNENI